LILHFSVIANRETVAYRSFMRRGLSVVEAIKALRPAEERARQSAARRIAADRLLPACLGRQSQARTTGGRKEALVLSKVQLG
jgi:hypothetical protein